jgi:hypothetical protein
VGDGLEDCTGCRWRSGGAVRPSRKRGGLGRLRRLPRHAGRRWADCAGRRQGGGWVPRNHFGVAWVEQGAQDGQRSSKAGRPPLLGSAARPLAALPARHQLDAPPVCADVSGRLRYSSICRYAQCPVRHSFGFLLFLLIAVFFSALTLLDLTPRPAPCESTPVHVLSHSFAYTPLSAHLRPCSLRCAPSRAYLHQHT